MARKKVGLARPVRTYVTVGGIKGDKLDYAIALAKVLEDHPGLQVVKVKTDAARRRPFCRVFILTPIE